MTVIAWDGKTLAADKRAINNGFKGGTVTKVHRWQDGLCAFAGDLDVGMQMVDWLRNDRTAANYPKQQQEKNACSLLVINRDGTAHRYESTPVPLLMENTQQAMGSGRDYALAAMHLGYDARRAVEVACALDSGCGNGIDALDLASVPPPREIKGPGQPQ